MYLSMLWRLLQVVQSPDATSHGVVVISWKSQGSLQSDHKNHLKFLNLKWCNISFPGSTSQLQDLHSYMATKLCSHSCLLAKRYAWSFSSPWERIALACTVPKFKQPRLELQDLNTLPNIPQLCMLMLTNLTISPPLQFGVASQKPCVAQYISNIHQNPPNPQCFGHRKPCPTCHDTLAHLWSWRWPLPQEDVVGQHHPSTLAAFPQSLVADCVQQRRSSFFGSMGRSTRELGLWGYGILGVWGYGLGVGLGYGILGVWGYGLGVGLGYGILGLWGIWFGSWFGISLDPFKKKAFGNHSDPDLPKLHPSHCYCHPRLAWNFKQPNHFQNKQRDQCLPRMGNLGEDKPYYTKLPTKHSSPVIHQVNNLSHDKGIQGNHVWTGLLYHHPRPCVVKMRQVLCCWVAVVVAGSCANINVTMGALHRQTAPTYNSGKYKLCWAYWNACPNPLTPGCWPPSHMPPSRLTCPGIFQRSSGDPGPVDIPWN